MRNLCLVWIGAAEELEEIEAAGVDEIVLPVELVNGHGHQAKMKPKRYGAEWDLEEH